MSTEVVAIIVSAIGVVLTLGATMLAAMVWVVRRIDAVAADVTDLKISVARLEGPPRHLLTVDRS